MLIKTSFIPISSFLIFFRQKKLFIKVIKHSIYKSGPSPRKALRRATEDAPFLVRQSGSCFLASVDRIRWVSDRWSMSLTIHMSTLNLLSVIVLAEYAAP